MDGEQRNQNKNNREGIRRAAREPKAVANDLAEKSQVKYRAVALRGKYKAITQKMRDEALVLISNGMTTDKVCEQFFIDRSSLLIRGNKSPDLGRCSRKQWSLVRSI